MCFSFKYSLYSNSTVLQLFILKIVVKVNFYNTLRPHGYSPGY